MNVREHEAAISKALAAMHPISRRACCDLAARTFLKQNLNVRDELMASFARAAQSEGISSVSANTPFMDIVANDLGAVLDTVRKICEAAMLKAEETGEFDIGEWFEQLGFGK